MPIFKKITDCRSAFTHNEAHIVVWDDESDDGASPDGGANNGASNDNDKSFLINGPDQVEDLLDFTCGGIEEYNSMQFGSDIDATDTVVFRWSQCIQK